MCAFLGHACTKRLLIVCLEFEFDWVFLHLTWQPFPQLMRGPQEPEPSE